jgi:hypothetical protein
MSLHEYLCSRAISKEDPPFYALLFALMRKADSDNAAKIKAAWPARWLEMQERYNAPGGILPSDEVQDIGDQVVKASGEVFWVCAACGHENQPGEMACEECGTERGCG